MRNDRRILGVLALLAAAACAGDGSSAAPITGPVGETVRSPGGGSSSPSFITAAPGAPTIANPVVSFWAKRGQSSEVFMYYASRPGKSDSSVFLRFRLKQRSLAFYPGGRAFANGDSVRITITLVDPVHLVVDCQPSGLKFDTNQPAQIKLSYFEADDDLNHDGVVNSVDAAIKKVLQIWKQDAPAPWVAIGGTNALGIEEIEADVFGFTTYAVAY